MFPFGKASVIWKTSGPFCVCEASSAQCLLPVLAACALTCLCLQAEHRTMAVFILAVIVNSYNTGQVRAGLLLLLLQVRRFSPPRSDPPDVAGWCVEKLHLYPALCSYFSCFYLFFSSPLSALSQYYINMTNHKTYTCSCAQKPTFVFRGAALMLLPL